MFGSKQFKLNGKIPIEEFIQDVFADYSPSASPGEFEE
jgi:hypothetical protein